VAKIEIKLVVLDWAGTTIDFGCMAPTGAFVASFAAKGVAVTAAEARAPMGLHKKDHIRAMLNMKSVAAKWRLAVGRDWGESDVDELYRDVTPRQLEAIKAHGKLIASVPEVVAELRSRGIKVASTTGYFREASALVLEAARQQGYVPDFAICADDVAAGRPAPWMIFRCMETLGVYPPSAVVKVGDTVVDIEDGLNAGCWSVGVVDSSNEIGLSDAELRALSPAVRDTLGNRVRERFRSAGAHAVLTEISELPELIERLNQRLHSGERP
jgi:phosphonoacetaldehyde hydrolase